MKNHYFKTKMVKMGQWAMLVLDSETWHTEHTSRYYKKLFGVPKGLLAIQTFDDKYQHIYAPVEYIRFLYQQIDKIKKRDFLGLANKLKTFYALDKQAREAVSKFPSTKISKLSNNALIRYYLENRDWVHRLVIFDQFTWLAEEYWTPKMEIILTKRLKLKRKTSEYNRVLYTLIKPEKISTTLKEKREVIYVSLQVRSGQWSLKSACNYLEKKFGWMPVFVFGEPWGSDHYKSELLNLLERDDRDLREEYTKLKNYTKIRNQEINAIVTKYAISQKDLQIFIDFGLAIDTRNEAEYFVSYAGFYVMQMYKEIARRLFLSLNQLRSLFEKEIVAALLGRLDPQRVLEQRRHYVAWGFDKQMKNRIYFDEKEAEKLFKYLQKRVKNVQENQGGKGLGVSLGTARGKARIVANPTENNKVKTGDILFTYSTTTDYLPAMKRAAAIVTEVGGLTCHAAVVSREFGIPCVVSVTNSMKVFKDGDLVEVDANKGIVKKI